MRKLILFFLLLAGTAYGQSNNTTNTKFTNGLAVPNGATQKPTSGLTAGALSYVTGAGLYVYNGTSWELLGLSSGGVTSFNGRTGVVVPLIGDYSSFYTPLTRSLTINGATQTLAADRTWTITANTPNSLTNGYGLTGGVFDGSVARTWVADTSSVSGLVSKLRLATNLAGYVKKATTITINGVTQDLSDNRIWTAGTVTSITPGYGLTPQTAITSTGGFGIDTLVLDTVYAKIGSTPTISFGTFGSTPNAQGGSYSGGVITLQPADATNPGGLSTIAQTIGGAKTFNGALTFLGGSVFLGNISAVTGSQEILQMRGTNSNLSTLKLTTGGFSNGFVLGLVSGLDDYVIRPTATSNNAFRVSNTTDVISMSSLSAGGLVKSTSGALGIATAGTDYLTPTGSGSGLSGVVLTSGGQSGISGTKSGSFNLSTSGTYNNLTIGGATSILSLANNSSFNTNGAFPMTLRATANSDVTLPTTGTLYGTATGSITSSQLATSLTDETGTGSAVFATSPTLTTPNIGVATADKTLFTGSQTFGSSLTNSGQIYRGSSTGLTLAGAGSTSDFLVTNKNGSNVISIATGGTAVKFDSYGAGTLTTDASGNITATSDERMKNISGFYTTGLSALKLIKPITYKWKSATKLDTKEFYTGFSAQNIHQNIPQAAGKMSNGDLTIQDRPIMATMVNAINELHEIIKKQDARILELEKLYLELKK